MLSSIRLEFHMVWSGLAEHGVPQTPLEREVEWFGALD